MDWVRFVFKCVFVALLIAAAVGAITGCAVVRDCATNACRGFH